MYKLSPIRCLSSEKSYLLYVLHSRRTSIAALTITFSFSGFGFGFIWVAPICLLCAGAGIPVHDACIDHLKEKDGEENNKLKPRLLLDARADSPPNPCAMAQDMGFCPRTRQAILQYHKCPGTKGSGGEGEVVQAPAAGGGGREINF